MGSCETSMRLSDPVQRSMTVTTLTIVMTLIVVLVVFPLFSLGGLEGRMFYPLACTTSFALIAAALLLAYPAFINEHARHADHDLEHRQALIGVYAAGQGDASTIASHFGLARARLGRGRRAADGRPAPPGARP